ncbi:MAG: transcriptional repressor LexA [Planctomycetota bacterium]
MISPRRLAEAEKNRDRIRKFLSRCALMGQPPTVREICQAVNLRSTATVQNHLRALETEGFLVSAGEGKSRGWRVREAELRAARGIPVVGRIAAGAPIESPDPTGEVLAVPPSSFVDSGEIVALKVDGESMREAGIHSGDYAIIRRQAEARNGEITAVEIDHQGTLKRWQQDDSGRITLQPANPDFEPICLDPRSDRVAVFGKLVGIFRKYE